MSAEIGLFALLAGAAALAAVGVFLALVEDSDLSRALGVGALATAAGLTLLSAGQTGLALAAVIAGAGHIIVVAGLAARTGSADPGSER
jgi:hypothetical protein